MKLTQPQPPNSCVVYCIKNKTGPESTHVADGDNLRRDSFKIHMHRKNLQARDSDRIGESRTNSVTQKPEPQLRNLADTHNVLPKNAPNYRRNPKQHIALASNATKAHKASTALTNSRSQNSLRERSLRLSRGISPQFTLSTLLFILSLTPLLSGVPGASALACHCNTHEETERAMYDYYSRLSRVKKWGQPSPPGGAANCYQAKAFVKDWLRELQPFTMGIDLSATARPRESFREADNKRHCYLLGILESILQLYRFTFSCFEGHCQHEAVKTGNSFYQALRKQYESRELMDVREYCSIEAIPSPKNSQSRNHALEVLESFQETSSKDPPAQNFSQLVTSLRSRPGRRFLLSCSIGFFEQKRTAFLDLPQCGARGKPPPKRVRPPRRICTSELCNTPRFCFRDLLTPRRIRHRPTS